MPRNKDNGFTLVEIILAITVLGILSGVMANVIGFYNGIGRRTYQVLQRQNELQNVLDNILEGSGDVPGLVVAKAFTVSGEPNPCELVGEGHGGTLTFTLPAGTEKSYRYDPGEGNLYLSVDDAVETVLLEKLTCFSAKDDAGKMVLLRVKATVSGTGGDRVVELATQVKPRNLP